MGDIPHGAGQLGHAEPLHRPRGLNLEHKSLVATEQDPVARAAWWDDLADRDTPLFVFVDESSANVTLPRVTPVPRVTNEPTAMPPPRRSQHDAGCRPHAPGPPGPDDARGAMNRDAVAADVEHVLVPRPTPGQLGICDTVSRPPARRPPRPDRGSGLRPHLRAGLFARLQPYRAGLQHAQGDARRATARTQDALETAIADALTTSTALDARGGSKHVGCNLAGQ